MKNCPCGSGREYAACCEPYLKGQAKPPTAEMLMRSRYSAFVEADVDYIEKTTDPSMRSQFDSDSTKAWATQSDWKGLEIVSTEAGGENDTTGVVEFIARYNVEGREYNHHERSDFKKRDGQWYFLDGRMVQEPVRSAPKVGRNDPCPCGSGKKFKKCCGA